MLGLGSISGWDSRQLCMSYTHKVSPWFDMQGEGFAGMKTRYMEVTSEDGELQSVLSDFENTALQTVFGLSSWEIVQVISRNCMIYMVPDEP